MKKKIKHILIQHRFKEFESALSSITEEVAW